MPLYNPGEYMSGPSGPGGQNIYDVVIPEDYSTLSAALAEVQDGTSILVKSGSYEEPGGSFSQVGISIHGSGGHPTLVLQGDLILTGDNTFVKNIEVNTNSSYKFHVKGANSVVAESRITNGGVEYFFETGYFAGLSNNTIVSSSSGARIKIGERNRAVGNHITVPHVVMGGIDLSFYSTFTGNFVYRYANAALYDEGFLIRAWGERCVISGNTFFCGGAGAISTDLRCTITGNSIFQGAGNVVAAREGGTISSNVIGYYGINSTAINVNNSADSFSTIVVGNNLSGSGSTFGYYGATEGEYGIRVVNSTRNTIISGNSITGVETGIYVGPGAIDTVISANSFRYIDVGVLDEGTNTKIVDNVGTSNDSSDVGTVEWGHIEGTLSNQSDLISALNNKMPLVAPGASGNVLTSDGTYWTSSAPPGGGGGGGGGAFEVVGDITLPSNASIIAIDGLDLDSDGTYIIKAYGLDTNVDNAFFGVNTDSPSVTAASYSVNAIRSAGTLSVNNQNPSLAIAGTKGFFEATLNKQVGGRFYGSFNSIRTDGRLTMGALISYEDTNVTRIKIEVSSGEILAGARLLVLKLV